MKSIKNIVLTTLIIILFAILWTMSIFYKNSTSIATNEAGNIIVVGQVKDKQGNPINGVQVNIIDVNSGNEYTNTTTDEKGIYKAKVSQGKYKLNFKYPNGKWKTDEIGIRKYNSEDYDDNLELAFVYNNTNDSEKQKMSFLNNSNFTTNIRTILGEYSENSQIKKALSGLQIDYNNENAFHYIRNKGVKGITILSSDKSDTEIEKDIDGANLDLDYNVIKCKLLDNILSILNKIYSNLGITTSDIKSNTIDNQTDNSSTTIEFDINTTTIINVIINKIIGDTNTGSLQVDNNYPNHISGTIYMDNNEVATKPVKVTLKKKGTDKTYSTETENGKYSISYPGKGEYTLHFDFINHDEINGQYYEPDATYYKEIKDGGTSRNCINTTNLSDIINKFSGSIDYKMEKKFDNNEESQLYGESNEFTIIGIKVDENGNIIYDSREHPIIADVRLKQREKFSLTVEENVSRYKIILSNSQVFKQYSFNSSNEDHKHYRDLRLFNITMDTKLSYGAKLYVEYEIKVTNNSNIDCKEYTLLSTFENLEYNPEQYLLKNAKENNSSQKWEITNNEKIKNKIDGEYTSEDVLTYLILKDTDGLKKNSSDTYYVTLTRNLDAENDDTVFSGTTEMINYKNSKGRRNYSNVQITPDKLDFLIKAGNYTTEGQEADTAISEQIAILPPTGFDIKTMCLLIISTIICLFGFKYLISNKLYINLRKTKIRKKWNRY